MLFTLPIAGRVTGELTVTAAPYRPPVLRFECPKMKLKVGYQVISRAENIVYMFLIAYSYKETVVEVQVLCNVAVFQCPNNCSMKCVCFVCEFGVKKSRMRSSVLKPTSQNGWPCFQGAWPLLTIKSKYINNWKV